VALDALSNAALHSDLIQNWLSSQHLQLRPGSQTQRLIDPFASPDTTVLVSSPGPCTVPLLVALGLSLPDSLPSSDPRPQLACSTARLLLNATNDCPAACHICADWDVLHHIAQRLQAGLVRCQQQPANTEDLVDAAEGNALCAAAVYSSSLVCLLVNIVERDADAAWRLAFGRDHAEMQAHTTSVGALVSAGPQDPQQGHASLAAPTSPALFDSSSQQGSPCHLHGASFQSGGTCYLLQCCVA
jgi:hypothetical protein